MEFDAFLSCARDVQDEVMESLKIIKEELEQKYGLTVSNSTQKKGIETSRDIICFISKEYDLSDNCKSELSYAIELGKSLIILMFTPFETLKHIGPAIHNLCRIKVYEHIEKFKQLNGEAYYQMIESLSSTNVKSKPIQLIYKQEGSNELFINRIALKIIESFKGDIGVCAIVGPYRQGKSFLMSRLIGSKTGFKLGHTDQSCTKGIWMWSTPIKLNGMNVLFLDTEGLESDESDEEWDKKMFMLSLLLSSYFIYNTTNTLQRGSLKDLAMVTDLSRKVRSSNGENENLENFPDFIWVIRDFRLEMTAQPKEMLERFLQSETGNDKKSIERNEIRDQIKKSFRSLDCAYLPIPELKVPNGKSLDENLRNIENIPWDDIHESFRNGMDNLCCMIKNSIKQKQINQSAIDGVVFAELIRNFVIALNGDSTIFLDKSIRLAKIAATNHMINNYINRIATIKCRIKSLEHLKFGIDKEAIEYHIKFCSKHYPHIPEDIWAQIFNNNNDSKNWPSILRSKKLTAKEEKIVKLYIGRWRDMSSLLRSDVVNIITRMLPSSFGLWQWNYYCRIFFACDFRDDMKEYLNEYPDLVIEPGFVVYCKGGTEDTFDDI